jgi:hypothetical protein
MWCQIQTHGNEKKRDHDAVQERHQGKQRTLKHYVERGQDPKRNSTNIRFSGDLLNADEDNNIKALSPTRSMTNVSDTGSVDSDALSSSPLPAHP